ncbi:MAG: hypothetical protein ACR2OE_04525 [Thermomicrobiales bacterium]
MSLTPLTETPTSAATSSPESQPQPQPQPLDRYIDRFLAAQGWRVTDVVKLQGATGYDVTLTKELEPDKGRTVTRSAASAGEATFKACSSARVALA